MESYTIENKYRNIQDHPQYFGGYLNMARLNIYTISNHIANELNQAIDVTIANQSKICLIDNEDKIKTSFLCEASKKLNWNLVYAKTQRFLPIIKIFDFESLPKSKIETLDNFGKDFTKMNITLKFLFGEIQEFRNDYSHYYSMTNEDRRKLIVSDELIKFLKGNFLRAIEYTKQRYVGVFTDEDFELATSKVKDLVNEQKEIQNLGLVFLISMFLEREYAFQFINKIPGLKGTQYKNFIVTREVLMAFCVKLPHQKLISENPEQAFALDLLNELNRSPNILFNVITEKEKEIFRPQLSAEKFKNVAGNSVNDSIEDFEEYIQSITKKVRNSNRFPYYALKYLDDTHAFKNFNFQIDLGKVCLDEYGKTLNNIEEPRRIVQNIKAFGNLLKLKQVEEIIDDENNVIESIPLVNKRMGSSDIKFEQFVPHYDTDNNKIGIKNKEDFGIVIQKKGDNKVKKRIKQPLADAFLSLNELPKIILLEMLKSGEAEKLINDFILLNNSKILNLEFIEEVKNKMPIDWDVFKKRSRKEGFKSAYKDTSYLLNRKAELNLILKDYNLNHSQIPTRIVNYWLNIKDVEAEQIISDKIKSIKDDCKTRLKQIKKNKAPKIGEMATFLAKDIVDMVIEKDKKEKITSFYYDKMQQCLALFIDENKKQELANIINELGLKNSGGHPFLSKINFNQKYTQSIYEEYVKLKLAWILKTLYVFNRKTKKTDVALPKDKTVIPYSLFKLLDNYTFKNNHEYIEKWLENVTKGKEDKDNKKPIDLPTNLFDESLSNLLKEKLNNHHISFNPSDGVNQLFKIWWKEIRKDDVQNFYYAEREYVVYGETINFKINTKNNFADYYKDTYEKVAKSKVKERRLEQQKNRRLPNLDTKQIENVFKKAIGSTEKNIRILQEEDRLMLLMLEKIFDKENKLNLKLNNAEALLNETIPIKQTIPGYLSFDSNGEILKQNKPLITKHIIANRKTKNHSILHKYNYDRRLPELFEYFDGDSINLEDLKIELDSYNESKQVVFDLVFELETAIVTEDLIGVKTYIEIRTGHIQHKPFLKWLLANNYIIQNEYQYMLMVRNAFSHNQYPQKASMEQLINQWNQNKWANQILEIYKNLQQDLLIKLKKQN